MCSDKGQIARPQRIPFAPIEAWTGQRASHSTGPGSGHDDDQKTPTDVAVPEENFYGGRDGKLVHRVKRRMSAMKGALQRPTGNTAPKIGGAHDYTVCRKIVATMETIQNDQQVSYLY
jgi:hypothetical protein